MKDRPCHLCNEGEAKHLLTKEAMSLWVCSNCKNHLFASGSGVWERFVSRMLDGDFVANRMERKGGVS